MHSQAIIPRERMGASAARDLKLVEDIQFERQHSTDRIRTVSEYPKDPDYSDYYRVIQHDVSRNWICVSECGTRCLRDPREFSPHTVYK